MGDEKVGEAVVAGVLAAAAAVEEQLDAELEKLDQMGEDELERVREERLRQMKQAAKQVYKSTW